MPADATIETAEGPTVTIDGRRYDWFRGNGYLGFQSDPDLLAAASEATLRYGLKLRDRRPVGCHPCVGEWDEAASAFFGCDDVLLLASGYLGGAVMASTLAADVDMAFVDEESHPNVWDGLAVGGIPAVPFRHRDPDALADALATHRERRGRFRPLVASDGVFPITGAVAPAADYWRVLEAYDDGTLCLDDAHAFGVIGENGRGTLEHLGILGDGRYAYGTMSKAFGAGGGVMPGPAGWQDRVGRASAAYRSATKPPPGVVAAGARALRMARDRPWLRTRLAHQVARVRASLRAMGLPVGDSPAPVVCLDRRGGLDLAGVAGRLFDEDRIAVLHLTGGYPNVPVGGGLVFTLSAAHDDDQVDRLLAAFKRAL